MPTRSDDAFVLMFLTSGRRTRRGETLALLGSGLAHGLVLAATVLFPSAKPLNAPRTRVIEVELVDQRDLPVARQTSSATTVAAPVATPLSAPSAESLDPPVPAGVPSTKPAMPPPAKPPLVPPAARKEPPQPAQAPQDGYKEATELYAAGILKEPASKEVRDTLPLLAPEERVTQLCNIEGLEQVRRDREGPVPDSLYPSAFDETRFDGHTLSAPGGAVRAGRKWYYMEFECVPGADLNSVSEFRYRIGDEVPRDLWEEHNLIPEDFDDD